MKGMSQNTDRGAASGLELLTVAFVVLKLTGVIDWPWVWVLSPVWISFIIAIVLLVTAVLLRPGDKRRIKEWK